MYVDQDLAPRRDGQPSKFNSYDSLDKYVVVLDFDAPIDNKFMFDMSW